MYTGFHAPTLQHCSALHIAERTYDHRTPFLAQAAPPESDTRELQQKVCKAVGWAGCKLELVGNRWSLPRQTQQKKFDSYHDTTLILSTVDGFYYDKGLGTKEDSGLCKCLLSLYISYIVIFSWNFDSMGCLIVAIWSNYCTLYSFVKPLEAFSSLHE